jgi:hypothetical protein
VASLTISGHQGGEEKIIVYRGMTYEKWVAAVGRGHLEPDKHGRLFVTTFRGLAEMYARLWAEREAASGWIVVRFDADESELEPDLFGFTSGAECCGGRLEEFFIQRPVAIEAVKIERRDRNGNRASDREPSPGGCRVYLPGGSGIRRRACAGLGEPRRCSG